MKKSVCALIIIALMTGAVIAQDSGVGEFGARFMWWRVPNIVAQLNLSEQQKEQLNTLDYALRDQIIELRAAEQKAKLELMQELDKDEPSETAVKNAVKKYNAARNDMMMEIMVAQVRARLILNVEQRKKLRRLLDA